VVLMPAHTSPHKGGAPDPGPRHRLRMCELAVQGRHGVEVSALEVERGGTSYTVDTLRAIQTGRPHAELTFIVGADVAAGLPGWREPGQIMSLARLAVVARTGSDRAAVEEAMARIEDGAAAAPGKVAFLDMPPVDVSSSLVRGRVAAGQPVDGLVPDAVAAYIAEHELYRTTDGPAAGSTADAGAAMVQRASGAGGGAR
jgi:nicotinate-nucleotide adenylyltransferase